MKLLSLPTKRFSSMTEAKNYVKGFEIQDFRPTLGDMEFTGEGLRVKGRHVPFTNVSWGQFTQSIIPGGGGRFLNHEETPEDLRKTIITRMMTERKNKKQLVRVEKDPKGKSYVKAFLSAGYGPYNNQQFIDNILKVVPKNAKCIRPRLHHGIFSVGYVNLDSKIDLPKTAGKRDIKLGVIYRNSEVGKSSVSMNPFSYDFACTNGLIVGKKFLAALASRVIHRSADKIEKRVLHQLVMNKDEKAEKTLRGAYINLINTVMTSLYYKHVSRQAVYYHKLMRTSEFERVIAFNGNDSRFQFMNRITEFAHKASDGKAPGYDKTFSEEKRLTMERLAGEMVEESLLS